MNTNTVQELIDTTLEEIAQAAKKGDLAAVKALTHRAVEYEDAKKTIIGVEERLKGLQGLPLQARSNNSQDTKFRTLPIEVTAGMIRQNLLTLTKHVKQRRIRVGDELTIEAQPSGERFRTEVLEKGNKLRERGAITRFYRDAGVKPGDFVILSEVAPTRWTLEKAPHGQYQSRRSILDSI